MNAPVEAVWPWLAQIGQDRADFSSYEWLENLAGCQMHNADVVHPDWQQQAIAEIVKLHWALGNTVARFEPNHALMLSGWDAFVVEPLSDQRTRAILRGRKARGRPAVYDILLIEFALPHLTSAFSTISHSIPRNGGWGDSAGSGLSFPTLLKQQETLSIEKKRQKLDEAMRT